MSYFDFLPFGDSKPNQVEQISGSKIDPASATKSTVDNKRNNFLSTLFSVVSEPAKRYANGWVDKQLASGSDESQKANAQLAANYWGQYNGSGPIDPGLAAINARTGNMMQFYVDPNKVRDNPQPPADEGAKAAVSNSMKLAGIALLAVIGILLFRR